MSAPVKCPRCLIHVWQQCSDQSCFFAPVSTAARMREEAAAPMTNKRLELDFVAPGPIGNGRCLDEHGGGIESGYEL